MNLKNSGRLSAKRFFRSVDWRLLVGFLVGAALVFVQEELRNSSLGFWGSFTIPLLILGLRFLDPRERTKLQKIRLLFSRLLEISRRAAIYKGWARLAQSLLNLKNRSVATLIYEVAVFAYVWVVFIVYGPGAGLIAINFLAFLPLLPRYPRDLFSRLANSIRRPSHPIPSEELELILEDASKRWRIVDAPVHQIESAHQLAIVMPFHNSSSSIEEAVLSVLGQDSKSWHLIMVDDGSEDSSPEIAKSFAERYPEKIELISTPNRGPGAARNLGLGVARTEYVAFLDSDDVLLGTFVSSILANFSNFGGNAGMFGWFDFDSSLNSSDEAIWWHEGEQRAHSIDLEKSDRVFTLTPPMIWNKVFRKEIIEVSQLLFPESTEIVEDVPTTYGWLLSAKQGWLDPVPQYRYRRGDESRSSHQLSEFQALGASILELHRRTSHMLTENQRGDFELFVIRQVAHGLEVGGARFAEGYLASRGQWITDLHLSAQARRLLRPLDAEALRITRRPGGPSTAR